MQYAKKLNAGVAIGALGLALFATPAAAQQMTPAPDPKGDAIVVTGSIVKNAAAATASPVTALTATDLANRGIVTIADAVQSLPANNAGTDPTSWTAMGGFATGASAISLRGFNDAYTLTLFNGMRTAYYPLADDGYRTIVDINTIPDAIVDRVDVLQDGASSTYGSDAVAGVVNVIIKKELQGLHLDGSSGISQQGDASEQRLTGTIGFGSLKKNGYNLYVNLEYQHNDPLMMSQRGFPYNTADRSKLCGSTGSCMNNGVANGIQFDGTYSGFSETKVGYAAPYSLDASKATGQFQLINPAAGCQGLNSITLTPAQAAGGNGPSTVCQQDLIKQYADFSPAVNRFGATAHFIANIGSRAQFTAMANYYQVSTFSVQTAPRGFDWNTAAGGTQEFLSPLIVPVYVCANGVGNANPAATGCNAANGRLNPYNPYAASGQYAQLSELYDRPEDVYSKTQTYRFSAGLTGSFGKDWNYDIQGTTSWIDLNVTYTNYVNAQNLLNLIATGGYNFANQAANSQATRDYLTPTAHQHNTSRLTQFSASLNKDVFSLPGGNANIAVGGDYRFEGINNPSANAPNTVNPYNRYFDINAVSVVGSRHVASAYYEISLPILPSLKLKADGRYDHYSVGGQNFSPKFEAQFQPISQIKFRGTYTRGFHAPSFSELFAAPTTGYVNETLNCGAYATFCAAHASNPAYYLGSSGTYSVGQTAAGNPKLSPEKSQSYTFGTVIKPIRNVVFTIDYWHTKISQIIYAVQPTQAVYDQYYLNNGVVNVPGFVVQPGNPDPQNPTALPLIGNVISSYANGQSEVGSGIDLTGSVRVPLGKSGVSLYSSANASYLMKLAQTLADGVTVQRFDGSLSPCNVTSCSGAPKWRAVWSNTLDFNGRGSVSLTANYTSGYADTPTDIPFVLANFLDGTPVRKHINGTFDLDMTASKKIGDHFTIYGNVINLLNSAPPFDPTAGYSMYMFNPAWGEKNFIGRYFRIGAKVDF